MSNIAKTKQNDFDRIVLKKIVIFFLKVTAEFIEKIDVKTIWESID